MSLAIPLGITVHSVGPDDSSTTSTTGVIVGGRERGPRSSRHPPGPETMILTRVSSRRRSGPALASNLRFLFRTLPLRCGEGRRDGSSAKEKSGNLAP